MIVKCGVFMSACVHVCVLVSFHARIKINNLLVLKHSLKFYKSVRSKSLVTSGFL